MGTLWHSYAKARELIELPFGVVRWVGPVIGVLDLLLWDLSLLRQQRNVLGSCEKIR